MKTTKAITLVPYEYSNIDYIRKKGMSIINIITGYTSLIIPNVPHNGAKLLFDDLGFRITSLQDFLSKGMKT